MGRIHGWFFEPLPLGVDERKTRLTRCEISSPLACLFEERKERDRVVRIRGRKKGRGWKNRRFFDWKDGRLRVKGAKGEERAAKRWSLRKTSYSITYYYLHTIETIAHTFTYYVNGSSMPARLTNNKLYKIFYTAVWCHFHFSRKLGYNFALPSFFCTYIFQSEKFQKNVSRPPKYSLYPLFSKRKKILQNEKLYKYWYNGRWLRWKKTHKTSERERERSFGGLFR